MTDEPPHDDLKALWREQETEHHPMSLELIHARGFQAQIAWRNFIEYGAAVLVVIGFGHSLITLPHPVQKLGAALTIAATVFVVWQLHRRGSARALPAGVSAAASLAFHRAELVRQRDATRSTVWWYFAPFALSMSVSVVGNFLAHPEWPLMRGALVIVLVILVFVGGILLNRWTARRLQTAIDDLDALNRD